MSQISVSHLTFGYEGSFDLIFDDVSFSLDTAWKLGFIGRNGKGKTTLLRLLMGEYPTQGAIGASVSFDYFPPPVVDPTGTARHVARELIAPFARWEAQLERTCADPALLDQYGEVLEQYTAHDGYQIDQLIDREVSRLEVDPAVLERPFSTLSSGERTKVLLAALFLKKNNFLLIDEPTNHLDREGRRAVATYLAAKEGFILVSHDRALLDRAVDHILSLNRKTIQVLRGNFSTWQENKDRQDQFEQAENQRLRQDVKRLTTAARQTAQWSDKTEAGKIATRNSGLRPDRGFIGHKAAKLMKRSKAIQQRREEAVEEKAQLLRDVDEAESLKLHPLAYRSQRVAELSKVTIAYQPERPLFAPLDLRVERGERVALRGPNGCGKSSILGLLLGRDIPHTGEIWVGADVRLSWLPQDTSFLRGDLGDFAAREGLDESLLKAILRKLDFARVQFEKPMEDFSGGQKKKVLLAASLCTPAHLYLWDEPLNFVDVLSRMQIEELLLEYQPTMVFVEHDDVFTQRVATRIVEI